MIHYLQYYRTDRNLGKGLNNAIRAVNAEPDDWFVINDLDTCYLTANAGKQIEQIAEDAPIDTGIIGCRTNRVGVRAFLYEGRFSNEWNIHDHIAIAIEREYDNWGELSETTEVVPGYFMMFRKEVYDQTFGFQENTEYVEGRINAEIKDLGLKMYIAEGLYIFHLYRPGIRSINQARRAAQHLKA